MKAYRTSIILTLAGAVIGFCLTYRPSDTPTPAPTSIESKMPHLWTCPDCDAIVCVSGKGTWDDLQVYIADHKESWHPPIRYTGVWNRALTAGEIKTLYDFLEDANDPNEQQEPEKLIPLEEYQKSRPTVTVVTEAKTGLACPECEKELWQDMTRSSSAYSIFCKSCDWTGYTH